MNILVAALILILLLVCVWAVVWIAQTFIVGKAPFIPEQFKQILNWIILVVAVIATIILIFNFVGTMGGSIGLLHGYPAVTR